MSHPRSRTTRHLAAHPFRAGVLAAAGVLVLGLAPPGPAAAEPAEEIAWTPCYAEQGPDFECAVVDAPLDHDEPEGEQIELAVVRLLAGDQADKLGSLFVNPGGPGGSGVDFVVGGGALLGEWIGSEAASRYDLVGVDPRGIGRSTPLECFDSVEEAAPALKPGNVPDDDAQIPEFESADEAMAAACESYSEDQGSSIGDHMSTANFARDLDLVRERLGEDTLNYYGISYGTQLGTTYANLFPDRVGAFVVDAVLDPTRWANRAGRAPFSANLRSGEGAEETLDRFLQLCEDAGPDGCALAPDARARFDVLAAGLREEPVELEDPTTGETFEVDYDTMLGVLLSGLYDAASFPSLAELLVQLEQGASPVELGRTARAAGVLGTEPSARTALAAADAPFPEVPDAVDVGQGFLGVGCADSENPERYDAVDRASDRTERTDGIMAPVWAWSGSTCTVWPFADEDRYTGPYTAETANPVLVIGNREDPATRYEGAEAVRELLPNSSLVTTETPGHGALAANACAGEAVGAYLLDPTTAPDVDGLVCPIEGNPFDAAATDPAAAGVSPELRQVLLEQVRPGFTPAAR